MEIVDQIETWMTVGVHDNLSNHSLSPSPSPLPADPKIMSPSEKKLEPSITRVNAKKAELIELARCQVRLQTQHFFCELRLESSWILLEDILAL